MSDSDGANGADDEGMLDLEDAPTIPTEMEFDIGELEGAPGGPIGLGGFEGLGPSGAEGGEPRPPGLLPKGTWPPTPEVTPAGPKPAGREKKRRRRSILGEEEGGLLSPAPVTRRSILG